MTKWQPIETAPKDGTPILAATPRSKYATIVEWDEFRKKTKGFDCWYDWRENGYRIDGYFTYWQPLPEPPEADDD